MRARSDGFPFFVQTWAYHAWNAAIDEPISIDDVARAAPAAGHATSAVSALRDRLIKEGVVYAPRYGWVEFAIPHFDDYFRRMIAD